MSYTVKILDSDDTPAPQRRQAEQRFCRALEETLGDASLVAPVYSAYLRIVAVYGEQPAPGVMTDAEHAIFEQWQAAETAAVAAAFGSHRYMGDAMYEIRV